jgi:hypothetical protein
MKLFIKKTIRRVLAVAMICCIVLIQCRKKYPGQEDLIGAWKVDSTFTYYNGFSYTQKEEGSDWGLCAYGKDHIMRESKYGTYRSFYYGLKERDSLYLSPTNARDTVTFQIVRLNRDQMVLKEAKKPLFESNGSQERYEIRYYSRTEVPAEKLSVLFGYKE